MNSSPSPYEFRVLSWLAFTHIIGLCSVRSLAFLRKILRTEMPKDGAQVRNAIF